MVPLHFGCGKIYGESYNLDFDLCHLYEHIRDHTLRRILLYMDFRTVERKFKYWIFDVGKRYVPTISHLGMGRCTEKTSIACKIPQNAMFYDSRSGWAGYAATSFDKQPIFDGLSRSMYRRLPTISQKGRMARGRAGKRGKNMIGYTADPWGTAGMIWCYSDHRHDIRCRTQFICGGVHGDKP